MTRKLCRHCGQGCEQPHETVYACLAALGPAAVRGWLQEHAPEGGEPTRAEAILVARQLYHDAIGAVSERRLDTYRRFSPWVAGEEESCLP